MGIEDLLQNFANATGIITDRTFNPPRTLGQAFLVSKSRMVTCAGCVFNYLESPWALAIKFPHPDVVLGVKTIALHPEFDRKAARSIYLSQTASSRFNYSVQLNDLATMLVQTELKDPDLELVGQLHRALSLPFSSEGVKASGAIRGKDFEEIVTKLLQTRESGLVTIFDELNTPMSYLQISSGTLERVYFQGITGEMAFAELIYRQPGSGYSFRPDTNFSWGELRKIEVPTADLINESINRAEELPAMLELLGGKHARYQKVVKEFSAQPFDPNVQWLINNIWQAIDGYATINQLSERVGADTYTVAQGLRELVNQGVVSLLNRQSPFHMNGKLGTPIVCHTDFDINPGDSLKAFYLDPVSEAPCWQDGDFAGVASVLLPKNLLHSIPIHLRAPGALVLKNYKLIGVHGGAAPVKPGQSMERQLYQMMWIGSLLDMTSKKLRTSGEGAEGAEAEATAASGVGFASLRVRENGGEKMLAVEKQQVYICSTCYATNTQLGNCFNCGSPVVVQPAKPQKSGFFAKTLRIQAVSDLQEKYNISDKQVFAAIGVTAFAFFLLTMMIFVGNSTPNTPTGTPIGKTANNNAEQAVKLAVNVVGFKGIAPPGFWFADTNAMTSPLASFALMSESSNQKVAFIIFNDLSPVQALDRFIQIPPFTDVIAPSPAQQAQVKGLGKVTEGSQILGENSLHYYVYNYFTASNTLKTMLVGSFPAKEAGKGVLVLGQGLRKDNYDPKSTLFLIDAMAESMTQAANTKRISTASSGGTAVNKETGTKPGTKEKTVSEQSLSSDEEIDKYCQDMQRMLQKKIDLEQDLQDQIKKRKNGKLRVVLEVDLDAQGNLQRMEIAEPDSRQKTNDDLVKIINAGVPYKNVPKTENELLNLRLVFRNGNITVERSE